MFYSKENWKKYYINEKLSQTLSLNYATESDIVDYYLRRGKEGFLPFLDRDFPLFFEYQSVKNINKAAVFIDNHFSNNEKTLVIYDKDLDGYGAQRIFEILNEEYYRNGNVTAKEFWNNIPIFSEDDAKQVLSEEYETVIFLDMGQNSTEGLSCLVRQGKNVLVIDHHLQDFYAVPKVIYLTPNFCKEGYPSAAGLVYLLRRQVERRRLEDFKKTYVILDIETTGLDPSSDDIIEIAAVKIEGGEICQRFEALLKTDKELPKEISAITGITRQAIDEEGKNPESMIRLLRYFIGESEVVAHNPSFDLNFLNAHFKRYKIVPVDLNRAVDTVELSRKFVKGLLSYSLESVVKNLFLYEGKFHRAFLDVEATYRLFLELLKKKNNMRTFVRDEALLIYYVTTFSDRMIMDGVNYFFLKKIDNFICFPDVVKDTSYSGNLINTYYMFDKLVAILNSKYRENETEQIDAFFRSKELNIFARRGEPAADSSKVLTNARELNPNGRVRVFIIEKKFLDRKGAVAAQLSKNTEAPSVILVQDSPLYGSARFLESDILKFFKQNEDLFITFGGHGKAVGFTIENFKVPEFIEKFEIWFSIYDKSHEPQNIYFDEKLPLEEVSENIKRLVKMCGPYGGPFTPPTYYDFPVRITNIRRYGGQGKSLFLELEKAGAVFYGISPFNGKYGPKLKTDGIYKILYTPMLKKYQDRDIVHIYDLAEI